jgi:modulator of FtsH protease HflC
MKAALSLLGSLAIFLVLFLLMNSAYTVDQTKQVILTQFGKPVGDPINANPQVNEAGLHFKTPFIQQVNSFEKRIMEWDGQPNEMTTRDKLYVVVDSFARWRISDPLKYFQSLRDERSALSRLDDIIGSETRNVVARHDLIEVIRTDKTRKPEKDTALEGVTASSLPNISLGREALEKEILTAAAPKVGIWGIELLDVRVKRVNYKGGVIEKIYDRMKSERMQIADRFRSEGAGEAAKIMGRKERDLRQIESDAYRKVQEIQGAADAQATEIYAKAYNVNPAAADFYRFVKTLETYKTTLGRDSTLILTTDSDLFKFLKRTDGGTPHVPGAPVTAP